MYNKETKNNNLNDQIKTSLQQTEAVLLMYNQLSLIRHSVKNHVLILNELCQKQNYEELESYIKKLEFDSIYKLPYYIKTSHSNLDAIINSKFSICLKNKIETNCIITSDFDGVNIENLTYIVSEIIDCALSVLENAANQSLTLNISDKRKYINIQTISRCCKNIDLNQSDMRHIEVLEAIVKKLDGNIMIQTESNNYVIDVIIKRKT